MNAVYEIDGTRIKDFVGLPHGAFKKLVNEKVDPLWGNTEADAATYLITFEARLVEVEYHTQDIEVQALNEENAIRVAKELANKWAEEIAGTAEVDRLDVLEVKCTGEAA